MSLSRKFFSNAALSTALVFGAVSAPALADVPAVGQCGPAEVVKAELTKAGYHNYFVYEIELFSEERNAARWMKESVYAKDGLRDGALVRRSGDHDEKLCMNATLKNIILADAGAQAQAGQIDDRFFKHGSVADLRNGINLAMRTAAQRVGEYPVVQAEIALSDGGKGDFTILQNSRDLHNRNAGVLYSLRQTGEITAAYASVQAGRGQTGWTPVGQDVLAKSQTGKRAAAGDGAVLAAALR